MSVPVTTEEKTNKKNDVKASCCYFMALPMEHQTYFQSVHYATSMLLLSKHDLELDLKQIHEDDLEAMDLKWQLSLLSIKAKRECRAPRNKEGQFGYQDNTRKQGNNEDTSSKEILAIDGVGFNWSDWQKNRLTVSGHNNRIDTGFIDMDAQGIWIGNT
ncbi:hypothetical protein Tco_0186209 [Tanacetum coccineum]